MPVQVEFQNVTSESLRSRTMPPPQLSASSASVSSNSSEKQRRWIKRYRTEVSASSASVLSTLTAFPLDSVKTRLQTYPYNGFTDCVRRTYQSEGVRGFFRGKVDPSPPPAQAATVVVHRASLLPAPPKTRAMPHWLRHAGRLVLELIVASNQV